MKFPEILIGKPIDPFPAPSLGGSTEYMLGWQEDVLHARPGGLGLRKTQILLQEDICQLASADLARADCTWWVSSVAEMLTQSWRHYTDSEGPPLVQATKTFQKGLVWVKLLGEKSQS